MSYHKYYSNTHPKNLHFARKESIIGPMVEFRGQLVSARIYRYYSDPTQNIVDAYTEQEKQICANHCTDDPGMSFTFPAAKNERGTYGARYCLTSPESFNSLIRKLDNSGFKEQMIV